MHLLRYVAATNTCEQPICDAFFLSVDAELGTCVYSIGFRVVFALILCAFATADLLLHEALYRVNIPNANANANPIATPVTADLLLHEALYGVTNPNSIPIANANANLMTAVYEALYRVLPAMTHSVYAPAWLSSLYAFITCSALIDPCAVCYRCPVSALTPPRIAPSYGSSLAYGSRLQPRRR